VAIVAGLWVAYWRLVARDVGAVQGQGYERILPSHVKVSLSYVGMGSHQRI